MSGIRKPGSKRCDVFVILYIYSCCSFCPLFLSCLCCWWWGEPLCFRRLLFWWKSPRLFRIPGRKKLQSPKIDGGVYFMLMQVLDFVNKSWSGKINFIFLKILLDLLKGTQDWEFFGLRIWILYYFIVSYAQILRFCKTFFLIGPWMGEIRLFRLVWD